MAKAKKGQPQEGDQGGSAPGGQPAPMPIGTAPQAPGPGPSTAGHDSPYATLQAFLAQNQGGATQMGQNLANTLGTNAQAAQAALSGTQSEFNKALGSGPQVPLSTQGGPSGGADNPGGAPVPGPALTDDQLKALADQHYTGPANGLSDMGSYSSTAGQVADAANALDASHSNEGRQALLEQQYGGRGNYSGAQSGLDAYLTGNAEGARQALSTGGAYGLGGGGGPGRGLGAYSTLRGMLGNANATASQQVAGMKQRYADASSAAQRKLDAQQGNGTGTGQDGNPVKHYTGGGVTPPPKPVGGDTGGGPHQPPPGSGGEPGTDEGGKLGNPGGYSGYNTGKGPPDPGSDPFGTVGAYAGAAGKVAASNIDDKYGRLKKVVGM